MGWAANESLHMDVTQSFRTVKSKTTEQAELTELDRLIEAAFETRNLAEVERLLDRKAGSRVHTVVPTIKMTKVDLEAGRAEADAWYAMPFEVRFPDRIEENSLETPEFRKAYKAARIMAAQAVEDEDLPIAEDALDEARDELYGAFGVIRSELLASGRSETELRLQGRIAGLEDWLAEQRAEFLAAIRDSVPTVRAAAPQSRVLSADERIRRATAYAGTCDPAISGSSGHNTAFRVSCAIVWGFGLTAEQGFDVLQEWNGRCLPPWSDSELWHKCRQAFESGGDNGRRRGYLLEDLLPALPTSIDFHARQESSPQPTREPADQAGGAADDIPSDLLNPGGFLGDLCEWYLDQSAIPQPEFALSAAIATLATLTGRKIEEPSGERTNLYLLSLGVTCSGKEAPAGLVERVLDSAGLGDRIMSRAASGAGLLSALRKQAVRLFNWDEFGIALKSISDNRAGAWQREIVANLLSLFTRANGVFRGSAHADGDHDANREIHNPHVVLLGSSTPSTFYEGLTAEAIESGLLGRCLMFVGDPKRLMNRDMSRESVPVEIAEQARGWIERATPSGNLAGVVVKPVRFTYSEEAWAELRAWGERMERQKIAAAGWRRAILGRVEQIGKRLALIHAASVGPDSKTIGVDSVRWASRLTEFLMNRLARHAEQNIGTTGYEKDLDSLVAFIAEKGEAGATRRDLTRAFRKVKPKEIGELLMHATEAGQIAFMERKPTGRGRPSSVYVATGD